MKGFQAILALSCLSASVLAQDQWFEDKDTGIRRTKQCPEEQAPAGPPPSGAPAGGAPAGANDKPAIEPPCWFHASGQINSKAACKEAFDNGKKCSKGPIFVPLGKYDVCVKFKTASSWFYTIGSNGHCSSAKCCQWYPPNICNRNNKLIKWFQLPGNFKECSDVPNADSIAITAPEMTEGTVDNEQKTLCIYQEQKGGEGKYNKEQVKLTGCAEGCCSFVPAAKN